jgi:hypothetical protein
MPCVDPLMALSTAPPGGALGDTESERRRVRCDTPLSNDGTGLSRRGWARIRLTPGHGRRPKAIEGKGLHGSVYELSAALTVDRFNGGRTDAEEAVYQAVSKALSDV